MPIVHLKKEDAKRVTILRNINQGSIVLVFISLLHIALSTQTSFMFWFGIIGFSIIAFAVSLVIGARIIEKGTKND